MLRFQTFRIIISVVMALAAGTSIFLGALFSSSLARRGFGWLLVGIEVFSVLRSVWSIIRKPCFGRPQAVSSEAISLFILFPFQLIIILILSMTSPRAGVNAGGFIALKAIAISSAIIHLAYSVALITISVLTVAAYDPDIWLRDIDSSPSPFPLQILFAFACPCIARRLSATKSLFPQQPPAQSLTTICLPGCSCLGGGRSCSKLTYSLEAENGKSPIIETEERPKPPVLAHTLIRIPNAVERRSSIIVELHVEP